MRKLFTIVFIAVLAISTFSQSDLQKLIETEKSFALLAANSGTKTAFLNYIADDGLLFLPEKVNGKAYWNARDQSKGLLSWAPNYADVTSNGLIGYTTGNWEFRSKGKDDTPAAFGEFVTVWQRNPDGKYKFIADIGIEHGKPSQFSTSVLPPIYPATKNEKNSSAADTANRFFEIAGVSGLSKAYETYAAKEVRFFREGEFPMTGKGKLVSFVKKGKSRTTLAKRTVFFGSDDIAYVTNTYSIARDNSTVEKGNYLQIWKLIDGRWQIVIDIFKPIPQKRD